MAMSTEYSAARRVGHLTHQSSKSTNQIWADYILQLTKQLDISASRFQNKKIDYTII
jgi:hypothetical protein